MLLAVRLLCLIWLPAQAAALNAFFAAAGPKSAPKQQLLDLCKDSNYGAEPIDRDRLDELIDELATLFVGPRDARSRGRSHRWWRLNGAAGPWKASRSPPGRE